MTFSFIDVKVTGGTSQNNEPQMLNEAKPDFLDFDKDGDKKEPMKKALRDKKKKMDSPTKDEPEGENGDTASMNPKIGDKTKKEYSMSMKPSKKKLYMSKESKIRTALKSVVENRGEHYRSATPPETIDDKLKGGGAKKMKADLMKGAKMNDTVSKAPEDAKAAGSRGPSAKPRSSGDNIRKGDTKIVQGGTPMKDPSSPKQRLESIMNAYSSMQEKNVNELSMKTLQRYRDAAAGDIQVKKGQAAIKRAAGYETMPRKIDKKIADRQAQRQIAKGKMMVKKAKGSQTVGPDPDDAKSSITKKRNESFSGTGVGTLGNIMDAYQSMNQQKSLNEEMHHIMNHVKNHDSLRSKAPGGIKYSSQKHYDMVKNLRSHHISVSMKHRECADKLASDPHYGPGHPLHMAHHEAADAHEKANKAHAHIMDHTNYGRDVTNHDNENFHTAMSASHDAASKSSETFHVQRDTR